MADKNSGTQSPNKTFRDTNERKCSDCGMPTPNRNAKFCDSCTVESIIKMVDKNVSNNIESNLILLVNLNFIFNPLREW